MLKKLGIIIFIRSIFINIGFIKTFIQFLETVLPTQVHLGLFPIIAGIRQNFQERRLSVHKDIAFQLPVSPLGIVVGLLQAQVCLLIVHAVGNHGGPVVGIHLQELGDKEDAGVAQRLAYRVQDKRGRERVLEGNPDDFLFQRRDGVRQMDVE